jgi:glycosyltransferase involved in cell wall biosynthesis
MLVSICIPTYSRLDYLKQCVASCLAQRDSDFEVCVSQDPRKDGPDANIMEWCLQMASEHQRFRYRLNERNLGLAGNWNQCVEMARGEYLIILGDDDLLDDGFLAALTTDIRAYRTDVAFCNQYFIDENGSVLWEQTERSNRIYKRTYLAPGLLDAPAQVVLNNSVPMSAALISRALLLRYPFDAGLNTPEFEVFLKIAVHGGRFSYNNKQLASYRVHAQAATSSGLTIDKLIHNVIGIEVAAPDQQLKHAFISEKMITGVNMSLRRGDKLMARRFLTSKYYPGGKLHIRLIQAAFLWLPQWAIHKLLKTT